jgi:hypothetical protein
MSKTWPATSVHNCTIIIQSVRIYKQTDARVYIHTHLGRSPENAMGTLLKLNFPWLTRGTPVFGLQVADLTQTMIPGKVSQ